MGAPSALEGAEPVSWWSQPIRGRDSRATARTAGGRQQDAGSGTSTRSSPPGGVSALSKALYDHILLDITNMSTFGRTTCIADKLEHSVPAPSDRYNMLNSNLIVLISRGVFVRSLIC